MKQLLTALLASVLYANAQIKQTCLVEGTINGLGNQPIFFSYKLGQGVQTDTILSVNDQFTYLSPVSIDSIIEISVVQSKNTFFWHEPGRIVIEGSVTNLDQLQVGGTPENEALNQYRKQVEWVYPGRIKNEAGALVDNPKRKQATINFIVEHPNRQTSVYLLFMLTVFNPNESSPFSELYQGLSHTVQTSRVGLQLKELLKR